MRDEQFGGSVRPRNCELPNGWESADGNISKLKNCVIHLPETPYQETSTPYHSSSGLRFKGLPVWIMRLSCYRKRWKHHAKHPAVRHPPVSSRTSNLQ